MALCDVILSKGDELHKKKVFDIEVSLLNLVAPKNFIGIESYEIQLEKNFEMICCQLNEHSSLDIKTRPVIEVYTLMDMLKSKNKNNGRGNN